MLFVFPHSHTRTPAPPPPPLPVPRPASRPVLHLDDHDYQPKQGHNPVPWMLSKAFWLHVWIWGTQFKYIEIWREHPVFGNWHMDSIILSKWTRDICWNSQFRFRAGAKQSSWRIETFCQFTFLKCSTTWHSGSTHLLGGAVQYNVPWNLCVISPQPFHASLDHLGQTWILQCVLVLVHAWARVREGYCLPEHVRHWNSICSLAKCHPARNLPAGPRTLGYHNLVPAQPVTLLSFELVPWSKPTAFPTHTCSSRHSWTSLRTGLVLRPSGRKNMKQTWALLESYQQVEIVWV